MTEAGATRMRALRARLDLASGGGSCAGIGDVFEALTVTSLDEPNSQYGLIAESVEVPDDRSWVAFTLNAEARFHDGSPITVADVIWSFDTLKARGRPFFRSYYRSVVKAEESEDFEQVQLSQIRAFRAAQRACAGRHQRHEPADGRPPRRFDLEQEREKGRQND